MKSFLSYFAPKNVTICFIFLFLTLQLSEKMIDFHTTGQIEFHFTKYFSDTRVNQIVNKCLNG